MTAEIALLPARAIKALTCENCGASFDGHRARFCSRACSDMSRKTMPCGRCGGPVWRGRGSLPRGEAVCRPCRRAQPVAYGPRASTATTMACLVCGGSFQKAPSTRRKTCSASCRRKAVKGLHAARPCLDCGSPIPAVRRRCDDCRDALARERWRAKNRFRRAVARDSAAEPYTLAEIAERDGYRCQIPGCHRKVNMQLTAPHPRSPSIDHVIPIVEGGGDVRANVQLAHWICNVRKGRRGAQQLALIG